MSVFHLFANFKLVSMTFNKVFFSAKTKQILSLKSKIEQKNR